MWILERLRHKALYRGLHKGILSPGLSKNFNSISFDLLPSLILMGLAIILILFFDCLWRKQSLDPIPK